MDAEAEELSTVAVALLRAHCDGDEDAINALLDGTDCRALLPVMVGLLTSLLDQAGVRGDAIGDWAQAWQAKRYGW